MNLRYLVTPLARACSTVHTPLKVSFKIIMLWLKCRYANRSYLRAGGSLRRRSSLLFVSFLCELLAIVVNFMFRSTMYLGECSFVKKRGTTRQRGLEMRLRDLGKIWVSGFGPW